MDDILIPVAPGELIDKLTILRLKAERIDDPQKAAHVRHEQALLEGIARKALPPTTEVSALWEELYQINTRLWQIEDDIRDREAAGDFGPRFVELARAVYVTNDKRADVKRRINTHLGSSIVEEKSYSGYGSWG